MVRGCRVVQKYLFGLMVALIDLCIVATQTLSTRLASVDAQMLQRLSLQREDVRVAPLNSQ